MSEGKQAGSGADTASTPALETTATVSPVSSGRGRGAGAGLVDPVLQDVLH